jgi:hypothetical protein
MKNLQLSTEEAYAKISLQFVIEKFLMFFLAESSSA